MKGTLPRVVANDLHFICENLKLSGFSGTGSAETKKHALSLYRAGKPGRRRKPLMSRAALRAVERREQRVASSMTKPKFGRLTHDLKLPWKTKGFFPAGTTVEIVDGQPFRIEGMRPMISVRLPGLKTIVAAPTDLIEVEK